MRNAPAVRVLCHGHAWRWGQVAVYALAAAAVSVWAVQHAGVWMLVWPGWPLSITVAAAASVAVAFTAAWLLRKPATELRWDGQQWWVAEQACAADLMLQTGGWVLVRLRLESGAAELWLAIADAEAGPSWHALLVALRAQVRADSPASQGWAL